MLITELKNILVDSYIPHNFCKLSQPLKVKCNSLSGETNLTMVYCNGKTHKITDEWGNTYSISSLSKVIQGQLKELLLSMKDSRIVFEQTEIYSVQ